MSAQATLIRTAIIELMQGTLGSVRRLPLGLFGFGVFEGQPIQAQQARVLDARAQHWFDVVVGSSKPHKATPISSKANYRIDSRSVTLRLATKLSTSADEGARLEQRERIEQAASDAIGVLAYPGNLTFTGSGHETSIVSGLLAGAEDGTGSPRYEVTSEDWRRQLHLSRIVGIAIVNVAQATA